MQGLVKAAAAVEAFAVRHCRAATVVALGVLAAEGARVAWTGRTGDFGPIDEAVRRLTAGAPLYVGNPQGPAYVYSPLVALVLWPLHFLPPAGARFLWFAGTWVALFLAWRLAFRLVAAGGVLPAGTRALAIASVAYFAYYNGLNGQTTPHMLALVLLAETLDPVSYTHLTLPTNREV